MTHRGRNVIRYWRGARRHPQWDLGTPPGRRRHRPMRRGRGRATVFGVALGLFLFGPVALDAASLLWRDSRGCTVWMVVDGDTVRMTCPGMGVVSGRILGIDTPEMKARCIGELGRAVAATYVLRWHLWTAGDVVALPRGRDRYDRVLTRLAVDGAPMATTMIRAGLARRYEGGQRQSWCE